LIKLDFGIKDYDEILLLQTRLVELKKDNTNIEDFFLIGEHLHVITMGRRPNQESNLKVSLKLLESKNIKLRHISRGGFATYHGPGQIVGYPIYNLVENKIGVRQFINKLEEIIISVLSEFNITSYRKPGLIGVWTDSGKIASIGVGVRKGISFHGFSLNVNTDLGYFNYIKPCGLENIKITSMKDVIGSFVLIDEVKKICFKKTLSVFNQKKIKYEVLT